MIPTIPLPPVVQLPKLTEERTILGPDGKYYTYTEMKNLVQNGTFKLEEVPYKFRNRIEHWKMLLDMIDSGNGREELRSNIEKRYKQFKLRSDLINHPFFEQCFMWLDAKQSEIYYEVLKYKINQGIIVDSELDKRIIQDQKYYICKCKAKCLEQIFTYLSEYFPGCIEEGNKAYEKIFNDGEKESLFGADERDEQYLNSLTKLIPQDALILFDYLRMI